MTSERARRLEGGGIRVSQALERVLGSEALLERLLGNSWTIPSTPRCATRWSAGIWTGPRQPPTR